jgi:hypothetical protein
MAVETILLVTEGRCFTRSEGSQAMPARPCGKGTL